MLTAGARLRLGLVAHPSGYLKGCLFYQRAHLDAPFLGNPTGGGRHTDRSHDLPRVIEDRGAGTAHTELVFLIVGRQALTTQPLEFLPQPLSRRARMARS